MGFIGNYPNDCTMNSEEREYWKDITNQCERKYEFLIDKLALFLDNKKRKA